MSVASSKVALTPGARIVVRDAEWVVRRVDMCSDGAQQLTCDGVSELVRSQEGVFLTSLEDDIEILDPARTKLVPDTSPGFVASRLFIESQLRQAVPSDEKICVGHLAAMDSAPYQLDPASQALGQPRQRILIADAVGLGKTLEAGILVSELIARGRGRRILALTVKSMLAQFQKEFWNRFAIPLTRLDSAGIRRVRSRIPTNHNPFYYYDKSIISIDTLKQDSEYRTYLETAYWDIIVIDEAHNVADRGTGSLRSRLAKLLSKRSDTLIMLSATPHDGKARSFASLMNMLDPTAITDPSDYKAEDFRGKGLVVRRFKKDIRSQVRDAFRDRVVHSVAVRAGEAEEAAYEALLGVVVARSGRRGRGRDLFSVGLEKALFSSPAACRDTVRRRIRRRERQIERNPESPFVAALQPEIRSLRRLGYALDAIDRNTDTRYQQLIRAIRHGEPFRWNGRNPDDRLVIFTERIPTMNWLAEGLTKDLKLRPSQVETLDGGISDVEQQRIVEDFGNRTRRVRLLVCSDVASEGINLHFRCHRLIHYDMPWSLMVFQQRNGRIDRFGQKRRPEIVYLVSQSSNKKIRGDQRILEVLKEKDEQAYKNIGDPSVFMNVHAIEAEEEITEKAIATGEDAARFDKRLTPRSNDGDDLMALFLGDISGGQAAGGSSTTNGDAHTSLGHAVEPTPTLSMFQNDLAYCDAGLHHLRRDHPTLNFAVDAGSRSLTLDAPGDLEHRFSYFPREVWPKDGRFDLTSDKEAMSRAIEDSRKNEATWPRRHYLWRQNPVVEWLNDRMLATFGRHEAPVLAGVPGLRVGQAVFAISGVAPNRKSHPLVCVWGAVIFLNGEFKECVPLEELLRRTGLDRDEVPNRLLTGNLTRLRKLLPEAVEWAKIWVQDKSDAFNRANDPKLDATLKDLESLKRRQLEYAERTVMESRVWDAVKYSRIRKKRQEIEDLFTDYLEWVQDTMILEGRPWIKVLCAMTGED